MCDAHSAPHGALKAFRLINSTKWVDELFLFRARQATDHADCFFVFLGYSSLYATGRLFF